MTREHFERLCFGDYVEPRWWDIERLLARVRHVSRGELVKTYPRMRRSFFVVDEPQQYAEAVDAWNDFQQSVSTPRWRNLVTSLPDAGGGAFLSAPQHPSHSPRR